MWHLLHIYYESGAMPDTLQRLFIPQQLGKVEKIMNTHFVKMQKLRGSNLCSSCIVEAQVVLTVKSIFPSTSLKGLPSREQVFLG